MIIDKEVTTSAEVRDHIIDSLRRELVGPSPGHPVVQLNGDEILRLQDPPRYRYACGILFPMGVTYSGSLAIDPQESGIDSAEPVDAEEDGSKGLSDDTVADVAATDEEQEVDGASMFLPSTMGISFLVKCRGGIKASVRWGAYHKQPLPGLHSHSEASGEPSAWFRQQHEYQKEFAWNDLAVRTLSIPLTPVGSEAALNLHLVVRERSAEERLITATLINTSGRSHPVNEHCFFQCSLLLEPLDGSEIRPYPGRPPRDLDDEERSLELLYRHRLIYAVGHGCAADWAIDEGRIIGVRTETLPVFDQAPVLPRTDVAGAELSLSRLAAMDADQLVTACKALAEAYEIWIKERSGDLQSLSDLAVELKEAGEGHLSHCYECLGRMHSGIEILASDQRAREAFQRMNNAMIQQREHYGLASLDKNKRSWMKGAGGQEPSRPYVAPEYPEATRWRPFQLAFILMNLRAFVEPSHSDRLIVDVIWFPTGGGKTEAYLGLAAFSILLRRLRDADNAGTTVLMRYTLRLLTTQQFQRAASLICALELQRQSNPLLLGGVPISIGLWVGGEVTPNTFDQAVNAYNELQHGNDENKFILLRCPWCGVEMGPHDYDRTIRVFGYKKLARKIHFQCEDPGCPFSRDPGLPIAVIDEALYESPPTLLIGTVDKFALMPWNPKARHLFGIDVAMAKSPPELVIQDEMHLISGPLGSMVGHYETLIDEFCTLKRGDERIPAKIVASTATIARARDQAWAVYGRESALFPPQGLQAGESFFASEGRKEDGRTYVGVLASALPSHVTAQVRVLSTLLQAPALVSGPGTASLEDPYWTLVVYFNSLRELGRAATLVQADIREYLNAVWDRIGLREDLQAGAKAKRRFINNFEELTSRLRSADVPTILQKLFTARPSKDTVDLCFATNMIQVGLDVPRLSVMSIVGQPKGASEYIQASSRVGRDSGKPGLVVTNFNPFKPRDRSHFESFRPFHENAYRHVEATSVTPFSIPVCDRAIHALAVSIARFRFPELRESPAAGLAHREPEIRQIIMERVRSIEPQEIERAGAILDAFIADWNRRRPQDYGDLQGASDNPLIWPAGKPLPAALNHLEGIAKATASSMRSVDSECEARPSAFYPDWEEA